MNDDKRQHFIFKMIDATITFIKTIDSTITTLPFYLNETIIINNLHLPYCLPPFNSLDYALYCGRSALYLLYEIPRKKKVWMFEFALLGY